MDTTKTLRILYAEDSPDDAELVARELRKSFPETTFEVVDTREEFTHALQTFQADLVLSDYNMPSFNGLEALKISLELRPDLPVLIVTGSINEETAVECLKAGATDYVLKESLQRLGQAVRQAMVQKELKAQRQRALQMQQESEERFRRLAENAQDMIYRFELSPQRKCTYMSPASLRITGYAPEEYYADPDLVFKYVHPEDLELLERMLMDEASVRQSLTLRYYRKDGRLIWKEQRNIPIFNDDGNLVALEGIARDVTKQKQVEEKLLLSDRVFNYTVDMFCIAGFDGFFKVLNPAWERTLGWSSQELMAKPFVEFVHPDDRGATRAVNDQMIAGEKVVRFENRYFCQDGSVKWLSWNAHPVPEEEILIASCRDVTEHKQALEALRESEEKYRSFVENSLDAILLTNPNGDILSANPAACTLFGMSDEEITSLGRSGLVDVTDPRLPELVAHRSKYGRVKGELYFKRKDGSRLLCEITSAIFCDRNGEQRTSMIIRDITERKAQEEALRESEEKFRTLFHNHSAAKMMIDPNDGRIVEVNHAACELYGWSESQFKTMTVADIDTLSLQAVMQRLHRTLDIKFANKELKHRKADGTVFDVEIFSSKVTIGDKDFLHSIVHDISEKKKQERQLRLLNRAVEQSPVTMIITDTKGRIEYVNPTFTRVSGYQPDEVIGQTPRILKSGRHPAELYKRLWETVLSGKDWVGELQNKKKDGSLYWVDVVISPIFNSQGEMTHFVSVREDITEKKNLVADLTLAKEKAEESDRLKSSFLANMSHEIRTPMNGIIGFLELLQESDLDAEVREEYLQVVRSSGDRLMTTLNDIIEISKIEAGHVDLNESVFDINNMLQHFCKFFRPEAEKKGLSISLIDQLPEGVSIKTDKGKLESILINLIKNALKFTTKGSIEIGVYPEEAQLVFYVRDTGSGIAADRHEAIFDRFTQAEQNLTRAYEGSGLGLSICKAYAGLLKGRIWLESEVGKGSTFYVGVPSTTQAGKIKNSPQEPGAPSPETPEDNALILIAEDDEASYYYLEVVLLRKKYRLLRAINGSDAVEFVRQNPGIQLVLMDIKMPEMDGYEATRQIRQFNQEIPIVAQTAFAMTDDLDKIHRSGFNDYVTKPIQIPDLLSMIKKYI